MTEKEKIEDITNTCRVDDQDGDGDCKTCGIPWKYCECTQDVIVSNVTVTMYIPPIEVKLSNGDVIEIDPMPSLRAAGVDLNPEIPANVRTIELVVKRFNKFAKEIESNQIRTDSYTSTVVEDWWREIIKQCLADGTIR
jgi:hypothetical protein